MSESQRLESDSDHESAVEVILILIHELGVEMVLILIHESAAVWILTLILILILSLSF